MKEWASFNNAKNAEVEIAFTSPLSSIIPYQINSEIYVTFILK